MHCEIHLTCEIPDKLREKTIQWLSPSDTDCDYETAMLKHHPGTGSWFLKGPQFAEFKSLVGTHLWIQGLRAYLQRLALCV